MKVKVKVRERVRVRVSSRGAPRVWRRGRCGLGAGMNAAQAADWPRLAEARGSLEHDLALRDRPLESQLAEV